MTRDQLLEDIEIDLLLEGVYQYFGDDFRGYERGPLRRKLHLLMRELGLKTISALQERVMHEPATGALLLRRLGSHPASLFEDAAQTGALRDALGPWLRSCAVPNAWVAECSSAEDVFSLAILLEEEGLYAKTQIFATAANESLLNEAREGAFDLERLPVYERNYRLSGGRSSLARYGTQKDGRFVFAAELRQNVIWAQYNLSTDTSFNEFQLIVCRRALTDFGSQLRRRALRLFDESLSPFGILCVDARDQLDALSTRHFVPLSTQPGLYRHAA